MARRRPTAFEISFPDEVRREEELRKKREEDEKERKRQEGILAARLVNPKKLKQMERQKEKEKQKASANGKKRGVEVDEEDEDEDMEAIQSRPAKKMQLDLPTTYYASKPNEIKESAETFLDGEDELFSDSDADSDTDSSMSSRQGSRQPNRQRKPKEKPIRLLTEFTIFDSRHRNEYVVLSKIEEEDGVDRRFEAAGWVVPFYVDEGDLIGGDGEGGGGDDIEPVYMRIAPILRYSVDWTKDRDPFYIETQHAWYILKMPTEEYTQWYQAFYTPRRVAQLVISNAIKRDRMDFGPLILGKLNTSIDIFGRKFEEDDLWSAADILRDAIEEVEKESPDIRLRGVPAISHILKHAPPRTILRPSSSRHSSSLHNHLHGPSRFRTHRGLIVGLGNPDNAVLKPENQNATHVTPLIASLVRGYVNEELIVVGPPPKKVDEMVLEQRRRKGLMSLWKLIEKAKGGMLDVDWRKEDRVNPRSNYLRKVWVGGEHYGPGDFVLVPQGNYGTREPPEWPKDIKHLPSTAGIANYFWFARIMYIKNEEQIAHVQWLEHASQTVLSEMGDPQELFLCNMCNPVPLGALIAKVGVHTNPAGPVKPDEYSVRFIQDKVLATFMAFDRSYHQHLEHYASPAGHNPNSAPGLDYCPSCVATEEDNHKLQWQYESRPHTNHKGKENVGIVFGGKTYHIFDFVLYRAEKGPSHIGQIIDMQVPRGASRTTISLKVQKVGRIWDLVGTTMGLGEEIKDERHVFLTNEEAVVPYTNITNKCSVLSRESFGQRISLRKWLDISPYHFYLCYRLPSLRPTTWDERTRVSFRDLNVCKPCTEESMAQYYDLQDFKTKMQETPLEVLDLFGGVGAFSLGLKEGSGCLKISHALEISPSAAKTLRRNSAGTIVINQCVNKVLQYVIKKQAGHEIARPLQLWDGQTPIPDIPMPGSVDMITAGFPCQTHSGLNMFKTANDAKSNLMLTALSWVDFYRPKFVYMENVSGFLSFRLNSRQATLHRVEGGVAMGGLKLLVRALLDMGYQVRYSLLQAGHYGTPQRRVRFFLIAAQSSPVILPLPELPQPTHDFPQSHRLLITMPNGDIVNPIQPGPGTAPHPFVSIEDAIGDLPRFDWKRPGQKNNERNRARQLTDDVGRGVPGLICNHKATHCGYKGRVDYHCEPRTAYQKAAREKESKDLQHFTKTVKARKVDRVLAIPMNPGADYRSLRADMHEWQFANPISSTAKQNFRPGWYGRLDKDGCFPTIVTNIDPMAKQSKVLHPYCKRMLTVREIARAQGFPDWFVFEAYKDNVITMHRQIGNAVPLPLSRALGRGLREAIFREWKEGRWTGGRQNRNDEDQEMQDVNRDSDVDSTEGLYA
ncbi:S-adenosyl-L-methionine-dependent methyltransferase [Macrolepiota fuliginosa MF-IS2]|uniref:DNA (cytosine-5)-methyltransferase n=1 Tax=Macrolepiota fuliginosa MF-IS2 TaxID=1400762 RepID=A0A9P5X3W0_9AGAR|nr:S-adenosyl-L-methionine-dependent methyltransferase [Macrolepiota fuliginosa MF-IS2]